MFIKAIDLSKEDFRVCAEIAADLAFENNECAIILGMEDRIALIDVDTWISYMEKRGCVIVIPDVIEVQEIANGLCVLDEEGTVLIERGDGRSAKVFRTAA